MTVVQLADDRRPLRAMLALCGAPHGSDTGSFFFSVLRTAGRARAPGPPPPRPPRTPSAGGIPLRYSHPPGALPVYYNDTPVELGKKVMLQVAGARYFIMCDKLSYVSGAQILHTVGPPRVGSDAVVILVISVANKVKERRKIIRGKALRRVVLADVWEEEGTGHLLYALHHPAPDCDSPPSPRRRKRSCVIS